MRTSTPLILACIPLLVGCSLEQRLDSVSAKIHQQFADSKSWNELPLRVISWEQALAMINRSNTGITEAKNAIDDAERQSISVYTEMIPGVSYYGYLTKSIKQLSNEFSVSDLNSDVNITFYLPSLTRIPYRVYASQATTFAAMKALEGKQRELAAHLYKLVRTRELNMQQRELDSKEPDRSVQDKMMAVKNYADADSAHWIAMCELLGDYSARWQVLPSSVPKLQWSKYESKLKRLDDLIVCMYALRLEQARLAQYQVALNYLPTINTSLYSPSLFSSSGGTYEGSFLSGEDTRLNLSLSYSFDTQLTTWNTYRKAKHRYEVVQREVMAGVIDHKMKLQTLRSSVREYNNWRSYMLKRIDYLQAQPTMTATELIERDKTVLAMKKELLSQAISAVESESALIIEYGIVR